MSLLSLFRPQAGTTTLYPWALEDYYVHVNDFGAVPDSTVAGGGTDSTAAFQAAIDSTYDGQPNAGKIVLVGPGRYKITNTLWVRQNSVTIMSPMMLHNGSLGNDVVEFPAPVINWHGPDGANLIEVRHITGGQISKFALQGIQFNDRRTSAIPGGNCVSIHRTVNDVFLKHLLFHGFRGGDQIHIDGGGLGGGRSDCIAIEKIWCLGNSAPPRYGIYLGGIDNVATIRDIRGDTTSGGLLALVKVEYCTGGVLIEGVKHENTGGSAGCTVEVGAGPSANPVTINNVTVRIGTGSVAGPNVRFTGQAPTNSTVTQLWRQHASTLLEGGPGGESYTGIHLPFYTASKFGSLVLLENGDTKATGNVQLATQAGKTLGFFGSVGTAKQAVTGNVTTGTLADLQGVVDLLLQRLAGHGLITDSTT